MGKENNKVTGNYGEDIACKFLEKQDYKIIERNFSCKIGEIDIIAKDKEEIVFIEVKTRNFLEYGEPAEAVNKIKKKHIYSAAEYYLLIHNQLNEFVRIDVIEIFLNKNTYTINHIKKAIIDKIWKITKIYMKKSKNMVY